MRLRHRCALALVCLLLPATARALTTSYQSPGSWNADLGQDCMDVYDFQVPDGTELAITVSDVVGSSVVRLALYGPGLGLGEENRLTGTTEDLQCEGQNATNSVDVVLVDGGTYRLAVVRDWGSSAGFDGEYTLTVEASQQMLALGLTVDDATSPTTAATCVEVPLPYAVSANGTWDCGLGESCQDLYTFDGVAGESVAVAVTDVTGNSVPRLALFAPGVGLDGINLLTGETLDRECVGQDQDDAVEGFVLPASGTYTLAVCRDWGSSAGFSGTYTVELSSSTPNLNFAAAGDDVLSLALGTVCGSVGGYDFVMGGSWDCGLGESCQDVWEVQLEAGATVTLDVFDVTGGSVPRLAVFAPGVGLDGTNLLTGTNLDRECVGQDTDDTVTFQALVSGTYLVAAVRDWGSSAGFTGTYQFGIASDLPVGAITMVDDDGVSQAAGSICQEGDTALGLAGTWDCAFNETCQDVFELELTAGSTLTVDVTSITGASVPRLALFAPGDDLDGVNLLTGATLDRECVGQDEDDGFADFAVTTSGTYLLAVGRDWGSSAGFSGSYALDVSSDVTVLAQQVADDVATQSTGSVCAGTDVTDTGSWDCDLGESCMDVYEVDAEAGSHLSVDVFDVTGASVPRLAIFAPGEALSGINLLTGENLDRECVGQDQDDSAGPVLAAIGGTYRVAIVRDWGSSAGFTGTYSMRIRSDVPASFGGQVSDDVPSQAAGSVCASVEENAYFAEGDWSCELAETCMDLYEFDLPELATITIQVEATGGSSVPRLGFYRPGDDLDARNVLSAGFSDRECVGQNGTDTITLRTAEAGVYTLAVGRDWGSSAGANGTYALSFSSDLPFLALGQTADDVTTEHATSVCGEVMTTDWSATSDWSCELSESCQDVYELQMEAGTYLSIAVTDLSGASVPRLALFAPRVPLSGTNLLTDSAYDRECVGQDEDDLIHLIYAPVSGVYRLAVGRDWGSSAGFDGTYRVNVLSDNWLIPRGQIQDDVASSALGSVCGTPVSTPDTPSIERDRLVGAFPNPFNPRTTVAFEIARAGAVRVEVFDARGRLVRSLVDEVRAPGRHEVVWDGQTDEGGQAASGVYFARMVSDGGSDAAKLLLLK